MLRYLNHAELQFSHSNISFFQEAFVDTNGDLGTDFDEQISILNFGARLLAAFTDKDILIPTALETLADFSQSKRVAILLMQTEDSSIMRIEGLLVDGKPKPPSSLPLLIPRKEALMEDPSCQRTARTYPLRLVDDVPLPASLEESSEGRCLCIPLIGPRYRVLGFANIELPENGPLSFRLMQELRVLATVLAISLENAALFDQAICDGLTGLYVRRYYDIRVNEELTKLKRQQGQLSVVIFDLDKFKSVNDGYGHDMGDRVLCEFAGILRANTRSGIDVVCRFGGEEFIVLMPDTSLGEAQQVAERIRVACESHLIEGQGCSLRVTVSGGVASAQQSDLLPAADLFKRADSMLYRAKEGGRNRIEIWSE